MRRYERILVQNGQFRYNGGLLTQKFQVEGVAPTSHSSQKTRLNDSFVWYRNLDRSKI